MGVVVNLTDVQYKRLQQAGSLNRSLTTAEQRVAVMATSGYTAKEIACRLGNRPKTVDRHIESITKKARVVYGKNVCFRSHIVPELCCYYFLMEHGSL